MKTNSITGIFILLIVAAVSLTTVSAQKKHPIAKPATPAKSKLIIFAVVNDGQALEPIAYIENGKLTPPAGGDSEGTILSAFTKTYYQPKTNYNLIFGGKEGGTVTVKSANAASDCAKNLATVSTQAVKAKLKGLVMGLATNATSKKAGSGVRRLPTYAEKTEVEALVRAEFGKQKIASEVLKNLHYQNLTALDVDNNGKIELVGSYWVETAPAERALLFFIAEKNAAGKYAFTYSNYSALKKEDVMNADIKTIDSGIHHELLIDVFDYDGDGASEIFTIDQGFEGNGFNVYHREAGKWVKSFEGSNYHCAY